MSGGRVRSGFGHLVEMFFERPAAGSLVALGVLLVPFSMIVFAVTEANATLGFTALGIASIAIGASLPRLEEASLSAQGAKFKLTPDLRAAVEMAQSLTVAEQSVDEPDEFVVGARAYLAGEALAAVLSPRPDEGLVGCHFRLYLYDESVDRLVPVTVPYEEADDAVRSIEQWEIGKGATGTAFARDEFVYVKGPAIWDTTYGVTEEQSQRFRSLTAVASMPVTNAAGETIGVISATTDAPGGDGLSSEDDAFHALLARSVLVARVLVDLLGWFGDA